ncbi:MAG: aspartate kinase [Bacteroidota bacterium]|nr:aspartate kinase [Bacteroidota bacterium]|tara:strand:+ start:372 stop:1031 length:660 start_codon:yes stop_codon:yes gene_type:complete
MKTISSVVEDYIRTKPYLSTALSQGIINLTSLSRIIKPDIEKILKKNANNGAIVMSLKRISDNMEFVSTHKIIKTLNKIGDITVRSSLLDYNFKISPTFLASQAKFLTEINDNKESFYTSSRGVSECNIIISSNLKSFLEKCFEKEFLVNKYENLSSVSIKLPNENVSVPGIYYFIFQRLSWEGVNIREVISTSNEFTILVDEDYVNIAFKVIKDLKNL